VREPRFAGRIVGGAGANDRRQRHDRRADNLRCCGMIAPDQRGGDHDEPHRERNARHRGHALCPEMVRAGAGGAETANAAERRTHAHEFAPSVFCWSMIFSENRYPLFGIML